MTSSIFEEYYASRPFEDRFARDPSNAIEIIIPVIHTNELWRANLTSIYREVPVRRLLISDGGCKDDSIEIAKAFPRVEILDHTKYVSLGYCLRKLIEAVESKWFAYLHSDVYLPPGWFDAMLAHQKEYDWFGCPQRITALVEYVDSMEGEVRPHAGSQMGRKAAFLPGLQEIDDDYVYRQEELVLCNIVEKHGFKTSNVEDTFHFHQVMHKFSPWARKLSSVSINVAWSREEEVRACMMQVKGIIKYLEPSPALVVHVETNLKRLLELNAITQAEFDEWVLQTKPIWKQAIKPWRVKFMMVLESARARSKRLLNSMVKA
jgi:hypothetical protein